MKILLKVIALSVVLSLCITSLPLAFAQKSAVEDIVNTDYDYYLETGADAQELTAGEDYVEGEILFTYTPGQSNTYSLSSITEGFGLELLETIDQSALIRGAQAFSHEEAAETLYRASFDSSQASVFELCKAMNELDGIAYCEPNYTYAPESFDMPTEITSSSAYASNAKWYFDNMNIPSTWQTYSNLGEGAVVCVIDNGLNADHNEIKNNLWKDSEGNCGYNAEFNNHDVFGKLPDGPAHGSHCAGIIAMEGSNGGYVGVAPKAKIMACNAVTSSTGYFTNANLIKSLEYAVANGADVISMSLGGYSFSFNMEKALARASMSAVILCAAGNEALSSATRLHYPSASGAVIGVMALGSGSYTNRLSSYSNYDDTGRYYQLAAPGSDIYSMAALSNTGYVRMSGTSMATPFMAGIAALYIAEHPSLSPAEARNGIIRDAGEMVQGYASDALSYSFKKATALTMLGQTSEPATQAVFNDRIIYAKVKDALGIDSADSLTNYDLECISHLDLSNTAFKNYAELANYPALTYLNLSGTNMSDADAKALMQYLPQSVLVLDVSNNNLTNLDFLEDFGGYLSRFSAAGNVIKNISGIADFTMLSDLDISSNQVKNISPVSSLTGLVYFYCPGNLIEDVSPILGIRALEEVYFGNHNPNFTDMFGELYFLSGSKGNRITSLEPLMQLNKYNNKLHYINLSYNYVQYDEQFNYRSAKLIQLLDEIGEYYDFDSIFGWNVKYKLVLSPCATGEVINAQDIVFTGGRNYLTLYLDGGAQKIPFSVAPANANFKTGVSFTVADSSVAYVNSEGFVYPLSAGSTYITLKLESGKLRTFYINVKESFVASASLLNPTSIYAVGESYQAVAYSSPCSSLQLTDQNGKVWGSYSAESKFAFHMQDKNGNPFIKWVVDFTPEQAGSYTIAATAGDAAAQKVGTFQIDVSESFGNCVYGTINDYNSHFDTTVSLLAQDDTVLQTQQLHGGIEASGCFRFSNVANGIYKIKIEKVGYTPYIIDAVVVEGDTEVTDGSVAINYAQCAGDLNSDGSVDFADASVLLAAVNYANAIESAQNILCDIDADNVITVADLSALVANITA